METTNLNPQEANDLHRAGILIRATNGIFINSSGYKTIKTKRQSSVLPDKIVNVHKVLGLLKCVDLGLIESIQKGFEITKKYKLETHHKNGNKEDNRIENIEPFLTRYQHNVLNYKTLRGD